VVRTGGKLVVTMPPLLRNFACFDLDTTERTLFGQFISGAYYTGVVARRHCSPRSPPESDGPTWSFAVWPGCMTRR
jgi:hypothetical protein